jgi:ATPase family AAA domain-containing protein 3A/B
MLRAQQHMQSEQLKKQEEMIARQEELRRKTAEYEADLRTKTELAKAAAEADGRIKQERVNHDLIVEKLKMEAKEKRDMVLKAIEDGGKMVGQGLSSYLSDTEKLRNTAIVLTAIAAGVYTTKTGAGVAGRIIEARLGKPSLVRETSRISASSLFKHPITTMKRTFGIGAAPQDAMKGIVLEEGLDSQLRKIAVSTSHTKKNRAPFRHLLLHGPPGTGKVRRNTCVNATLQFCNFCYYFYLFASLLNQNSFALSLIFLYVYTMYCII